LSIVSGLEQLDLTRKRVLIVVVLIIVADVMASLFLYKPEQENIDMRTAVTDMEVMVSTGSAAALGLLVAIKQGWSGLHGKTYASLAIGLILWTAGEVLWVYAEVVLQNELPDASIADVLWISGYGFFGYHLFKNYQYFGRTVDKKLVIIIGALIAASLAYVSGEISAIMEGSSADLLTAIMRISYGVGDFVIIYPAILLVITLRKARLHFSPWFFVSVGLLLTASADVMFAFVSIQESIETEWISNLLYNAANMSMAGGLYWYYKHIVSFGTKAQSTKVSPPGKTPKLLKNEMPN